MAKYPTKPIGKSVNTNPLDAKITTIGINRATIKAAILHL
jgi:hypothetical protein